MTATKTTNKAARDAIIRARTTLLVSNGFFGFLAMQLRLVEATVVYGQDNPTMCVDGVSMFYNPEFVLGLTERELEGVLAHEVMHCCFSHFTRRGSRDPHIFNIAGDFVINYDLTESGFTLPWMQSYKLPDPPPKGVKAHCYDPKYANMSTEAVYDDLMKNAKKVQVFIQSSGNGPNDAGGMGGVLDAPGGANGAEATKQTWETSVRTAIAVAKSNNAGKIPGSLKRLIEDLAKPKISWRDLTRRFIDQSMIKDVSWARLSRRSVSVGTLLPGLVSDRLQQLVFFVDVSGSVSDDMLHAMVSEIGGALDEGTADELVIAYADTHVRHVDRFVVGDIVKGESHGGGGTDFRDSFNWLKENCPQASCVVYLTDLRVSEFGEEPECPVLWAVFDAGDDFPQLTSHAPFGECIAVDIN